MIFGDKNPFIWLIDKIRGHKYLMLLTPSQNFGIVRHCPCSPKGQVDYIFILFGKRATFTYKR